MTKFVTDWVDIGNYLSLESLAYKVSEVKTKYPEAKDFTLLARSIYEDSEIRVEFKRYQNREEKLTEEAYAERATEARRQAYEVLRKEFGDK